MNLKDRQLETQEAMLCIIHKCGIEESRAREFSEGCICFVNYCEEERLPDYELFDYKLVDTGELIALGKARKAYYAKNKYHLVIYDEINGDECVVGYIEDDGIHLNESSHIIGFPPYPRQGSILFGGVIQVG